MTVALVFQATSDDTFQDNAPSAQLMGTAFVIGLSRALAQEDPSKVRGVAWAGPIRVTRKVREAHLPGGVTSATGVLLLPRPDIMMNASLNQYTSWIVGIRQAIEEVVQSAQDIGMRLARVYVTEYNDSPTVNGPLAFWTSGTAATTHTRDRFPQTNTLGVVGADQNENQIGPNDPRLVPVDAPPVMPTMNWVAAAVAAAAVLGVVILAKTGKSSGASQPTLRPARSNPRDIPWAPIAAATVVVGGGAFLIYRSINAQPPQMNPPESPVVKGQATSRDTSATPSSATRPRSTTPTRPTAPTIQQSAPPPPPVPSPIPSPPPPARLFHISFTSTNSDVGRGVDFGSSFQTAVTAAFHRTYLNVGGSVVGRWLDAPRIDLLPSLIYGNWTVGGTIEIDGRVQDPAGVARIIAQRLAGQMSTVVARAPGWLGGDVHFTWTDPVIDQV